MEPYVDYLMAPEDWVFVDAADETGLLPEGSFQIDDLERAYRRGILDQKDVAGQRRFCVGTFHKRMECCMRGERSRFESLPTEVRAAMVAYEQDIDLWVLPTRKPGVNQGIITPLPIEAALEKVEESTCRYYVQECDCRVYHHDQIHMRDSCIHFFEGEPPLNSNLHRGYGRELTKEQAKELLVALDRDGLVHNWEGHGFCNCCACCCWAMRGMADYEAKGYDLFDEYIQADYVIQTHPQSCVGCGACLSICPTQALRLEDGAISVDRNRCLGCGVCRTRCHVQALTIAARETPFAADLTTEEMERMRQEGALLIDTRENAAYIGWTVGEAARGGHIPGAVDFSALWLKCPEGEMGEKLRCQWLPELLKRKHIDTATALILCDTNGHDAAQVAHFLRENGCSRLYYYDMAPWTEAPSRPLVRYPNYELLVPAFAVHALLHGEVPETFSPGDNPRLLEVSWGEAEETSYATGHVPGAIHVNTDWFEPPEGAWMLDSDENLEKLACRLGICAEDCVIVTGQELAPVCRFAVILRYLGVRDVRVMSGGMLHWQSSGYELDSCVALPEPVPEFGIPVPGQPQWILSIPQVQARLGAPDFTLVDTRSWEEYTGKTTGYSYHHFAGRIPGSVFGYPGPEHSSSPCQYRNPDNTPGNREEVLEMWQKAGIDLDTHLSFFCGGGWRAAEILWFARVFGLENTSLFSDGWCGWSNRGLPSVSGEPEDA